MITMYTIRPETTFAADNIRLQSCGQKCECIAASCTQKGPWYHQKAGTHEIPQLLLPFVQMEHQHYLPLFLAFHSYLGLFIIASLGDIFGNSSLHRVIYHCFSRLIFLAFHSYLGLFIIASLGQYFWHFIAT